MMCTRSKLLLSAMLGFPALTLAQQASAPSAQAPATQAQVAALQQAVQNAQSAGDNAWMLVSAALVLLMTGPGLALFYGGLVRKKNILGTMMQSFAMMGLVTILWAVVGYSLAFGHGNAFIGGFEHLFLRGVGLAPNPDYAATIPEQTYMIYQLMFAIITPALITGAFAERMKFSAMAVFLSLWSLFVYCPMAHMVWGVGGLLNSAGAPHPQPGFRRRHRGPHHQRRLGAGHLHLPGQAHRLSAHQHAAPLHGAQLHRRLPAVGGLVRLQRRQRAGGQPPGHQRLRQHPLCRRRRRPGLDHRRVDSQRQAHRPGRHLRRGRRTGRHHPGLRLCPALRRRWPSDSSPASSASSWSSRSRAASATTTPSTPSACMAQAERMGALLTGLFATSAINAVYGKTPPESRCPPAPSTATGDSCSTRPPAWPLPGRISIVGTLVLLFVVDKLIGLRVSPEDESEGLDLSQHGEEGYDLNT